MAPWQRLLPALVVLLTAGAARAQGEVQTAETPSQMNPGEFTPGSGFQLARTEVASLNVSVYGLARYLNHLPGTQSFVDHLGRTAEVKTRNDINWHRTFVWLSGHFWRPQLRYTASIWSLPTTQQTLVFGNLRYKFHEALEAWVGIGPNLGSRSMQGPWPFFLATDRQMADEFFRPGFTSSAWISGQPVPGLFYSLSLGNNISQLGTVAANDTRDLSTSASVWCLPTTAEFGPRGGFGDFEHHESVATRLGASLTRTRDGRYAPLGSPPNNTQIRISDGRLLFETGSLAEDVTVQKATYGLLAVDAGAKWRGFHLQTEYYFRRLWDFDATASLPVSELFDHGFYVQASQMIWPKLVGAYAAASLVFDDFGRRPWEVSAGLNVYPSGTRNWRLNLHYIYVDRSPTGSSFGYYVGGQTGSTVSLATDFLL